MKKKNLKSYLGQIITTKMHNTDFIDVSAVDTYEVNPKENLLLVDIIPVTKFINMLKSQRTINDNWCIVWIKDMKKKKNLYHVAVFSCRLKLIYLPLLSDRNIKDYFYKEFRPMFIPVTRNSKNS